MKLNYSPKNLKTNGGQGNNPQNDIDNGRSGGSSLGTRQTSNAPSNSGSNNNTENDQSSNPDVAELVNNFLKTYPVNSEDYAVDFF